MTGPLVQTSGGAPPEDAVPREDRVPAAGPRVAQPFLSVVVPTTGNEAKLSDFLEALARQSLPRSRFEVIVVFDGAAPTPAVERRLRETGARTIRLERRSGPPIARNRGAALARGEFLASTDDDVVPEPDWLERAAARLESEPELDVLEGVTKKPGGRAVRVRGEESHQYILCNLFVRRSLFERIGGFHLDYYDPANGVFFREDADLGYSLEAAGARVARDMAVVVTHPIEHPRFLDPLRWARRYEMDALLMARHPRRFRESIEVHTVGPLRIRRPILRASFATVAATSAAAIALGMGQRSLAAALAAVAIVAFVPVWAKWRFDPVRLPVYALVPFALVIAYLRGFVRLRRLHSSRLGVSAGAAR